MRIKHIRLNNIRSYIDETIMLPSGSTLLSGSIGCGKSTALLAIDFAFFGIQKGVSGGDLLRHGSGKGFAEVSFEKNGEEITIRRRLKRTNDSVTQESGSIICNGVENDYTATEIKAKVLEMFGYPQDSTKKNRPIFKYTVYTPQEQLKQILLSDDERLATLRQIFGVDKYGVIRENAKVILAELRAMTRELNASARGLEELESLVFEIGKKEKDSMAALVIEKSYLEKLSSELQFQQKALNEKRAAAQHINSLHTEHAQLTSLLSSSFSRHLQIAEEIEEHNSRIYTLKEPSTTVESAMAAINEKERHVNSLTSDHAVLTKDIERIFTIMKNGICTMCGKTVDKDVFAADLEGKKSSAFSIEGMIELSKNTLASLREDLAYAQQYKITHKQQEERLNRIKKLTEERLNLESTAAKAQNRVDEIFPALLENKSLEAAINEIEQDIAKLTDNKISAAGKISGLEQQILNYAQQLQTAQNEIKIKKEAKERSLRISALNNWLETVFVPMISTMEKHVMYAIQQQFDGYFQHWFSMLMDESLGVRIDENFSPHIEQNGYDTEFNNLSGGEKTSVALAYRLALNMVINKMIDTIQTKDILILDEPTDGFSTDQLDKLRNVLNELKLNQIIIVSHEQKMDAYVDNIIRIHKDNHVSRIIRDM